MKENKIERVELMGGFIGWMLTNPRKALDNNVKVNNRDGYELVYMLPHKTTNMFIVLVQVLVLIGTLGLWTWGAGYILVYTRNNSLASVGTAIVDDNVQVGLK
jgi:hypothetical protein